MRILVLLMSVLFLFGCASGDKSTEIEKSVTKKKSKDSEELQDVKTVDKTYSENIKSISNLKRVKSKVACSDHSKVEKTKWRDLLEAGFSCIQDKNWSALNGIAEKLSHNHLKAPWGPYYRSIVSEHRGDLARAMWMIDLADKKAPNNSLIMYQKARVLWLTKNESESYSLMKKVIEKDPKNYDALLFLGNVHYRDRDFKTALTYFEKVMQYNYKDAEYRAAMGESLYFSGKHQESIKHYKAASAGIKINASLLYKTGLAYKNIKNWNLAKTFFEKAISQKRKGRSLASLGDMQIRKDLREVVAKIEAGKPKNKKQKITAKEIK
jgi:tetratricopeptide (TPR) repeat protein